MLSEADSLAIQSPTNHGASDIVLEARIAQQTWLTSSLSTRIKILKSVRHLISENGEALSHSVQSPSRSTAQVLMSEVIPLADGIRFLETNAKKFLRPERLGRAGRPTWLFAADLEIHREPFGVILIVGPANYPLFLPAIQALQAIVAGNAVIIKSAPGHSAPLLHLAKLAALSGLDPQLLQVIDDLPKAVYEIIEAGIDKVILTGGAEAGRAVLAALAPKLIPAVMELSGCDGAFVLPDADLDLASRAIQFGRNYNGGNTCIAPKRIFVDRQIHDALISKLAETDQSDQQPPISIFACSDVEDALTKCAASPFALGASVFGSEKAARSFASKLNAGVVVINDCIVPTADPRLPFGGRKDSGFGVTRGREGLLEMTRPKSIVVRGGKFRPHFEPESPEDFQLFQNYLQAAHARSIFWRLRKACSTISSLMKRGRSSKAKTNSNVE